MSRASDKAAGIEMSIKDTMDTMHEVGMLPDPPAIVSAERGAAAEISDAIQKAGETSFVESIIDSDGGVLARTEDFLFESEGSHPYVYSDETAAIWRPGSKGIPTVGMGFNMERPNARAELKAVGADFDKLMAGKQQLSITQQQQLLADAVKKDALFLRNHFKGISMPAHRWLALISLTYNSRWKDEVPTLIGPLITAAIKEGRWEDAALEIEFNSAGGVSERQQAGINARRRREAEMFRGANLEGRLVS